MEILSTEELATKSPSFILGYAYYLRKNYYIKKQLYENIRDYAGKIDFCEQELKELKEQLAKLPHIPNKQERRKIRQEKAKLKQKKHTLK